MAKTLTEELLHFSAEPLAALTVTEQERQPNYKPRGLWVSVGESWAEWCEAESFGLGSHVTRVELADGANMLRLAGAAALDHFTAQYGGPIYPGQSDLKRHGGIRWAMVAEKYDGIIIAPYCWERRHELMWYYGWDCASGCIWHPRAIVSLESCELARESSHAR